MKLFYRIRTKIPNLLDSKAGGLLTYTPGIGINKLTNTHDRTKKENANQF